MWEAKWFHVPHCILYTWYLNLPVSLQTADIHAHSRHNIFHPHSRFFLCVCVLSFSNVPTRRKKKNAAGLESFCRHPRRRHKDEGSSSEAPPPVSFAFFSSRPKAAESLCRELGAAEKFFSVPKSRTCLTRQRFWLESVLAVE